MKTKTILILSLGTNILFMIFLVVLLRKGPAEPDLLPPMQGAAAERAPPFSRGELSRQGFIAEIPVLAAPKEAATAPEPPAPLVPGFEHFLVELEELGLRVVPDRFLEHLSIQALDSGAQVTDAMRELLALGEEETKRLNHAFADAAQRLRGLEVQNMEVLSLSDEEVLLRISPLGPEARQMHDGLRLAVYNELGDVDGALFWDIMQGSNNQAFWSGFGEKGLEVIFTLKSGEAGTIGVSLERKPVTAEVPRSTQSFSPLPPALAARRIEDSLMRHRFLIDHLPDHMKYLLSSSDPE